MFNLHLHNERTYAVRTLFFDFFEHKKSGSQTCRRMRRNISARFWSAAALRRLSNCGRRSVKVRPVADDSLRVPARARHRPRLLPPDLPVPSARPRLEPWAPCVPASPERDPIVRLPEVGPPHQDRDSMLLHPEVHAEPVRRRNQALDFRRGRSRSRVVDRACRPCLVPLDFVSWRNLLVRPMSSREYFTPELI